MYKWSFSVSINPFVYILYFLSIIQEPPPRNSGFYNYDDEVEYQSPRGRPRERVRSEMQMRGGDRAEHMRTQYDDLIAQGQPTDSHDLKPVFCHNPDCFEDKKVCFKIYQRMLAVSF